MLFLVATKEENLHKLQLSLVKVLFQQLGEPKTDLMTDLLDLVSLRPS